MKRPLLLDLFCCQGGAAAGYVRAGFDVWGVDVNRQPRYLRSGATSFIQADALDYLRDHGGEYDAIHASPPCQAYTTLRALQPDKEYPDLLAATRTALEASGKPWVIENVPGSPLHHGVMLCGGMFGLRVYRHRWFETPFLIMQPEHPRHRVLAGAKGTKGGRGRKAHYLAGGHVTVAGNVGTYCGGAMGIDWMTGDGLSQAIPPAYTRWIGQRLLAALKGGGGT